MARAKTILPSRPSAAANIFTPPTEQEKAVFAEKLAECCVDEVDGHEHQLVRLVYAVKNIVVTEKRREELHRHLYVFETVDDLLITEAEAMTAQINSEMAKKVPPKTKAALEAATESTHLPKDIFIQRFMDNKVGKLAATFMEFGGLYKVVIADSIPKEL